MVVDARADFVYYDQGVAPTLLYPVPSPERYPFLSKIIHSVRDYYPLWQVRLVHFRLILPYNDLIPILGFLSQLVYQTTVFLSRSSISLGIPPLPARFLPLPAILQSLILFALVLESAFGMFAEDAEGLSITAVFLLISVEGTCGGLA